MGPREPVLDGVPVGMTELLAQVCTLLALVSAAAVLLRTRDVRLALGVLLQLLLAAGLLRLSGDPTWRTVLLAAVVVGLRQVLVVGLRGPVPAG